MRVKAESMILKNKIDKNKKVMADFFSISPSEEVQADKNYLAETGQTTEIDHAGKAF